MAGRSSCFDPSTVCPVTVAALHRHPEYVEIFPIGAGLVDWVVAGV